MEEQVIKSKVVGVDISNERTTYAVVDIRGNILSEGTFETNAYPDVNDFVTKLCECLLTMSEENGGYEAIRSIGISCPSVSAQTGCIENAANLPWKGVVPLAAMLRDRLGMAVGLANDARISALGEKAYGSAHGMKNFIVVNIGVGVGSCFFSDGHEHVGAMGFAGEIGHTTVCVGGRKCGCGKQGCLEAYAGAKGIVQTAQELMAESSEPSLMRDIERLTPRLITECCEKGDKLAIEVYRKTGRILGWCLANYASLVNPEAIILAGGISRAGHWLFDPIKEVFEQEVFLNMRGRIKLFRSNLDDHERDVLGASALAWDVPEYSLFK